MGRQISFKTKLLLLCVMLNAVSVVVGVVSYISLKGVSTQYSEIANINLPNIRNSDQMFLAFRNLRIHLQTLVTEDASDEQDKLDEAKMKEDIALYEKLAKDYTATPFQPGEGEIYEKVDKSWKEFIALAEKLEALNKLPGKDEHAKLLKAFNEELPPKAAAFKTAITALTDFHQKDAAETVLASEQSVSKANWTIFAINLGGILAGLAFGYFFSNSVANGLRRISEGLDSGAETVNKVATEIASAADALSSATTQQAAAIQETTAAVEETSAMVAKNAENAKISTEVSAQSQSTATRGQQAVDDMIQSIDEISQSNVQIMNQIEESNREISEIVKVISEIGNKTKVINDIVFQTKLLSFNASVEAARAGEHGKGFAVVAEEVGNLAEMSGNSAKEISEMLDSSIKKVEDIVNNTKTRVGTLIQSGKQKVDSGTATAKRCSEILEEIVSNVSKVGSLVEEISTASGEQSRGIVEINKAMSELDNVAQQNSASSQQAASSAESLKDQVQSVRNMAIQLNEILNGAKSGAPVAPNVIAIESAVKKAAPKKNSKPGTQAVKKAAGFKQAAGFDVPSSEDPGFND